MDMTGIAAATFRTNCSRCRYDKYYMSNPLEMAYDKTWITNWVGRSVIPSGSFIARMNNCQGCAACAKKRVINLALFLYKLGMLRHGI
jgi:hypothetical protein